jgi:hypothetical protein
MEQIAQAGKASKQQQGKPIKVVAKVTTSKK